MSQPDGNQALDSLLENAQDCMDYWTGTIWEKEIQHLIDTGDYESLWYKVLEARQAQYEAGSEAIEHFHDYDLIPKTDPAEREAPDVF